MILFVCIRCARYYLYYNVYFEQFIIQHWAIGCNWQWKNPLYSLIYALSVRIYDDNSVQRK